MNPSQQNNRFSSDNQTIALSACNDELYSKEIQSNLNIHEKFNIDSFKSKYIFKPFEYEEKLEQTLTHKMDSLNAKPFQKQGFVHFGKQNNHNSVQRENFNSQSNNNSLRTSHARFGVFSNAESFNSTSKSIKTNKTIFFDSKYVKNHSKIQQKPSLNLNDVSQIHKKPSICRPPDLMMKKAISFTSNAQSQLIPEEDEDGDSTVQGEIKSPNGRSLKKKILMNKEKYEEDRKIKGFTFDKNKFSSVKSSEQNIQNLTTPMKSSFSGAVETGVSLCQSIALANQIAQNSLKSTSDNGFINNQQLANTSQGLPSKNSSQNSEYMSFYQFCMLLFPQTSKSIPCSVFVMDTLFYVNTGESKEIIYVFKDRKRNLLTKMKNKNKSAYELFMKRRVHYETTRLKEEKLRKTGYYDQREKGHWNLLNGGKESCMGRKEQRFFTLESLVNYKIPGKEYESSVKCLQDSNYDNISKNDPRFSIVEEDEGAESQEMINMNKKRTKFDRNDIERDQMNCDNEKEISLKQREKQDKQKDSDLSFMGFNNSPQNQLKINVEKISLKSTFKKLRTQNQMRERLTTCPQKWNKKGEQFFSPDDFRLITPSNSIRQSIHSLQTNYLAVLKYSNNQMIRLKAPDFKAIFYNPLYANEKFKNNNNTQYIQALPIEEEFKDLKVYSLHFYYDFFKDEQLFLHVINSLYKENQYMANGGRTHLEDASLPTQKGALHEGNLHANQFLNGNNNLYTFPKQSSAGPKPLFDFISPQSKRNILLKQYLKQQSTEIYLYYQIFQIYTYVSMHYNKQILSGVFRFIEYDNDFALFQTQNLIAINLPKDGLFIRAKIFADQEDDIQNKTILEELKLKIKNKSCSNLLTNKSLDTSNLSPTQTPSQTMKKITREIFKLSLDDNKQPQTMLQKQLTQYFTKENNKIQQEMSNYFTDKVQKIKNIKDSHLSKNIFKVIHGLPSPKDNESDCLQEKNLGDQKKGKCQKLTKNYYISNSRSKEKECIDFHEILNDEKKLERFLKEKQQNDPYARKNISNYSVIRWKQEIQKVKERKNINNLNKEQQSKFLQMESSLETNKKRHQTRPMTAYSLTKQQKLQESLKFKKLNPHELMSTWNSAIDKNNKTMTSNKMMGESAKNDNNSRLNCRNKSHREGGTKENLFFNIINDKINQKSYMLSTTQLGQSMNLLKEQKQNKFSKQKRDQKKFEKKLINQKYTQWNKTKFKLNGFKADKFF